MHAESVTHWSGLFSFCFTNSLRIPQSLIIENGAHLPNKTWHCKLKHRSVIVKLFHCKWEGFRFHGLQLYKKTYQEGWPPWLLRYSFPTRMVHLLIKWHDTCTNVMHTHMYTHTPTHKHTYTQTHYTHLYTHAHTHTHTHKHHVPAHTAPTHFSMYSPSW